MSKISISLTIIGILFQCSLFAQTDSLPQNKQILARQIINLNFPGTRNLDIQLETNFPGRYKVKMPEYGYYEKGTVKSYTKAKVNGNFALFRRGKFSLSAGASYQYRNMKFKDVSDITGGKNIYHNLQEGFHVFGINSTIGYGTVLFNKNILFTGTVFSEFSSKGFELWAGIATATVVLKSSYNEILSVGISGFTHHTSIFPILPIFVYLRRLSPVWILDCTLPGYFNIRRLFGKHGRFSTGVNFDSDHFYIHPTDRNNEKDALYFIKTEVKLHTTYEHRIGKHFFFTAKTGYTFPFNCKFYDSDELMRDALGKYKEHPNFFVNIGVSYNL